MKDQSKQNSANANRVRKYRRGKEAQGLVRLEIDVSRETRAAVMAYEPGQREAVIVAGLAALKSKVPS